MKTLHRNVLIAMLVLPALLLLRPSSAHAQEMTCPPPVAVSIDVTPGDRVNKINLSSKGLLPVAVLSTQDFDALRFTPEMAHLNDATAPMDCSGAEAVRWNYSDVNGDRLPDLVFFFRVQDLSLAANTTAVTLMGHGSYDTLMIHIMGTDAVIVKP